MGEQSAAGALIRAEVPPRSDRLGGLFEAHSDRLYRLARRLTRSRDEARDLVQETFLRAASALASVPFGHRDEEKWLVRVLVNAQRDHWRKVSTRKRLNALVTVKSADPSAASESTLIARMHQEAFVSNADIAAAAAVPVTGSEFGVQISFNAAAAEKVERATMNHVGKPIVFLIDGNIVAAPVLRSPIRNQAQLNANFRRQEAERLANGIIEK